MGGVSSRRKNTPNWSSSKGSDQVVINVSGRSCLEMTLLRPMSGRPGRRRVEEVLLLPKGSSSSRETQNY